MRESLQRTHEQDADTLDAIRDGGERLGPLPFSEEEQRAIIRETSRYGMYLGDTMEWVGVTPGRHPAAQDTFTRLHDRANAENGRSRGASQVAPADWITRLLDSGIGSPEHLMKLKVDQGLSDDDPLVKQYWDVQRPAYDAAVAELASIDVIDGLQATVYAAEPSSTLEVSVDTLRVVFEQLSAVTDDLEQTKSRLVDATIELTNAEARADALQVKLGETEGRLELIRSTVNAINQRLGVEQVNVNTVEPYRDKLVHGRFR
jgi:exonuclease VII small subunit